MLNKCDGKGKNPFIVNVITFSGHGITFDGDAIAVIPEYEREDQKKVVRFINFSDWARGFAEKSNTLSIFILSMCRVEIKEVIKNEIIAKEYLKEQLSGENEVFKFLINDARSKNKINLHNGYSVILFGTQVGKVVIEGELI